MATVNLNDYFAKMYKTLETQEEKRSTERLKKLKTNFERDTAEEQNNKVHRVHEDMLNRILLLIKNEVITIQQGQAIARLFRIPDDSIKKPTARSVSRTPVGGCVGGARAC